MQKRRLMTAVEVDAMFARFSAIEPCPRTELAYTNPFTLLVAVVLSAQMTDKGVNKATAPLFARHDTPEAMLRLGEEGLIEYIRSVNFHRGKARSVIGLSHMILEEFGGAIPTTREELERLPGVGRKTANVWLNSIHGVPFIGVDTHVFRVSNRTGLALAGSPLECELKLEKRIPGKWKRHAHHWLILHGRYTCVARVPKCWECPVIDLCHYPDKTLLKARKSGK